jgi:hypothetical protein
LGLSREAKTVGALHCVVSSLKLHLMSFFLFYIKRTLPMKNYSF